jgi:hypothetical protein
MSEETCPTTRQALHARISKMRGAAGATQLKALETGDSNRNNVSFKPALQQMSFGASAHARPQRDPSTFRTA